MKKCFFNSIKIIAIFLTIIYSSSTYMVSALDYTDIAIDLKDGNTEVPYLTPEFLDPDEDPNLDNEDEIDNLLNTYFYTEYQCGIAGLEGCSDNTFKLGKKTFSILPRTNGSCNILLNAYSCNNLTEICSFESFDANSRPYFVYTSAYKSPDNADDYEKCGECPVTSGTTNTEVLNLYERDVTDVTKIKFESIFNDNGINTIDFNPTFPSVIGNDKNLTLQIFMAYLINQVLTNSEILDTKVCRRLPDSTGEMCDTANSIQYEFNSGYINNNTCFKGISPNYTSDTISETYYGIFGLSKPNNDWDYSDANICLSEDFVADSSIDTWTGRGGFLIISSNCYPGDFYKVLIEGGRVKTSNSDKPLISCGSSFNKYNKASGHHCFANYGSNNIEPQGCGLKVAKNVNSIDITETLLCDPLNAYSYCVGTGASEDIIQGSINLNPDTESRTDGGITRYEDPNHAHQPENYPDTGFCLNCVSDNGSGIQDMPCEIYDENFINKGSFSTLGIYDNCCSESYYCMPNSPGDTTGTCQEPQRFEVCGKNRLYLPKDIKDDVYIKPGAICNYSNDGDIYNYCDRCSNNGPTTKDGNGNDLCGVNAPVQGGPSQGGPSGGTVNSLQYRCKNDCGCLSGFKCINSNSSTFGLCVPENACADDNAANPNNLDCCNQNATKDSSNKCNVDCNNSSIHDPNSGKCVEECCTNDGDCQETGSTNGFKICVSGPCKGKDINECCGAGKVCNNSYDCVDASPTSTTDDCAVSDDGRPPRGGYGRPEEAFTLEAFIRAIIGVLYPLSIVLGMIYIVMGGYQLVISKGDPEGTKKAQQTLTSAVTGLIFIILSATILRFIVNILIGI